MSSSRRTMNWRPKLWKKFTRGALSGFGRFAMKAAELLPGFPKSPQSKQGLSHLKAAPIMMSAGVLLLVATGLLFLCRSRKARCEAIFRQQLFSQAPTVKKTALTVPAESPVTEDQLAGRDVSTDAGMTGAPQKARALKVLSAPLFFFGSERSRCQFARAIVCRARQVRSQLLRRSLWARFCNHFCS